MLVYRSKFRPGDVKDKPSFLTSPLELFLSPDGSGDLGPTRGGGLWTHLCLSTSELAKQPWQGTGCPLWFPAVPGMGGGMTSGVSL